MNFNTKKTLIEKIAISMIIGIAILMITMIGFYIFVGVNLVNNPESFGEWFQRLSNGFNE